MTGSSDTILTQRWETEVPGDGPGGEAALERGATVVGRGRSILDLAHDLVFALADMPRAVVCDLDGAELSSSDAVKVFTPVVSFLSQWPGSGVVVVCAPDSPVRTGLGSMSLPDGIVLSEDAEAGADGLDRVMPEVERAETHLDARLTAPRRARLFAARTLLDWRLLGLVAPASLVVTELVTNSVVHAASTVDLTLSQAGGRLLIAVRDHGIGSPEARDDPPDHYLGGRGLLLVQEVTRGWGVFPARPEGKMVWAVLESQRR